MRGLPFDLHFEVAETRVHLVHGSPRKVNEYLFEDKPPSLYERLAAAENDDALVFGHTHKPWVHDFGGVRFVNCGSVGKPKDGDPRGAFAVLPAPQAEAVDVTIERVAYDASGRPGGHCRRAPRRVRREAGDGGLMPRPTLHCAAPSRDEAARRAL